MRAAYRVRSIGVCMDGGGTSDGVD